MTRMWVTPRLAQTPEDKKRRNQMFEAWDMGGRGVLSLAEVERGIEQVLLFPTSQLLCQRASLHLPLFPFLSVGSSVPRIFRPTRFMCSIGSSKGSYTKNSHKPLHRRPRN